MSQGVCHWARPPRLALSSLQRCPGAGISSAQTAAENSPAQGNSREKLDRCKGRVASQGLWWCCVCTWASIYVCVPLCAALPAQLAFQTPEDRVGKTVAHEEPFKEKDLGSADDLALQQV